MSAPNLLHLLTESRDRLVAQAEGILNGAESAKRDLTGAEGRECDALIADLTSVKARIADVTERQAATAKVDASMRTLADAPIDPRAGYKGAATRGASIDPELNERFRRAVATRSFEPIDVMPTDTRSGYQPGIEARTMTQPGNVGTTFYNTILRHLVANSAILAAGATLLSSDTGEPFKVPKSTANSAAAIVVEGAAIPNAEPSLSSATLNAYKYGCLIKITTELANDANFDLVGYLAAQAGTALANGAGADFITGNGTGKPLGVAVSATTGITGGTAVAGAFTADNLVDLLHSVAEPYSRQPAAGWLMNNATLAAVRKLKDSQNRYLFDTDAPMAGSSGSLLGRPVYSDPNVANIGLNARSVLFGDMSRYWIRSVGGVRFEQSVEFAFDTDVVTFRALWRTDGVLVDQSGAVKAFVGGAT